MPPYSSGQSKIRPGFPRLQEVRFLKNSDLTIENVLTLMDKMSKTGLILIPTVTQCVLCLVLEVCHRGL